MDASLFRSSRNGKPPLRIGVLLNTPSLPRCFSEVLDHIVQSDFATIDLVVYNGDTLKEAAEPRRERSAIRKVIETLGDAKRRRTLFFNLYERWDLRNADPSTDPIAMVDCSERLSGVNSIRVDPITKRFVHRFPADAVERIRAENLDVLIRFGFNILRGEILTAARYGVWSYHHGDNDRYRGGPACFWEVLERCEVSGALLQVLTEDLDAGQVLCKGLFATEEGLSHARNRVRPFWGASTFMIQKLHELHARGWEHVERQRVKPAPYQGRKKIYSLPTNVEMLRWLAPLLIGKILRRLTRRPVIRHWRIAVRVGAAPVPESTSMPEMKAFRWIDSPKGQFYADPFVVEVDGKHWVFFEDCSYSPEIGKISCAEVRDGELREIRTVLERPYHLSYPCVFRDGDDWYMIPETMAAGAVELYRCTRFPDTWQYEAELLKGRVVDTTLWINDDVYWFFVTYQEPRGGASQLWLYSAPSLKGAWTPHPDSPISTDVRYSRGAGAIFRNEGKLYRPSQDCSVEYGRRMIFNEILELSRESYREEPRLTVNPDWMKDLVGTHTYGRAGTVEIIDGKTLLPVDQVI